MRTKCLSVRLESLVSISGLAFKATAFDGSSAIIPKSQVFGPDYDVQKSEAYWISEWILSKKDLQYSGKKSAWFDVDTRRQLPDYVIEKHIPEPIKSKNVEPLNELMK
jgi:hypothetical protein